MWPNRKGFETLATRELSNTHVISCHVMWITCLLVSSFWEGSSSLMEARDGSLESVSKTLSIRPHWIMECTVPLSKKIRNFQFWFGDIFGSVGYMEYSVKVWDIHNYYKWAEYRLKVWYVIKNATQLLFTRCRRITICNQMTSSMVCWLMFWHASRRCRLKYSEFRANFSENCMILEVHYCS